jgi:shikimate dehydrogenase
MLNIEVNKHTLLYGLLGYPLGHSFSPPMHNAAFAHLGLNKAYFLLEVSAEDLGVAVAGMKKLHFGGGNVSIPHKVEVMKYLDEISESAALIGAVNVLKIEDGKVKGFNTDGSGFFRSFETELGASPAGKVFFINGAGGASRAITMEAVLRGAKKVYICNRTYAKAGSMADEINARIRPCAVPLHLDAGETAQAMRDVDVFINTTNIGMYPKVDDLSFDVKLLRPGIIVCDAIYNPGMTRLLQEASALGCQTMSGVNMLINQGAESFQIWTGLTPPIDVMGNVIRSALAK